MGSMSEVEHLFHVSGVLCEFAIVPPSGVLLRTRYCLLRIQWERKKALGLTPDMLDQVGRNSVSGSAGRRQGESLLCAPGIC
jgi:hypothetical protein